MSLNGDISNRIVGMYVENDLEFPLDSIIIDYPSLAQYYFLTVNPRKAEFDVIVIEENSLITFLNPLDELPRYLSSTCKDVIFDIRSLTSTQIPGGWVSYEVKGHTADHIPFRIMYLTKMYVSISTYRH